jgi:hypothetical protein
MRAFSRSAWRTTTAALISALAVLPAACGGSSATPTTAAPREAALCGQGSRLVTFMAGDGFTFHNRLVLGEDGSARVEYSTHLGPRLGRLTHGETSFTVDGGELARVRAALSESDFATLREQYLPESPGADLPSYEITHCGKDVFVDGFAIEEKRVPVRLLRLIDVLNDLVEPEVEQALERGDG